MSELRPQAADEVCASEDDLRSALRDLTWQLQRGASGRFDFRVESSVADGQVQELEGLLNGLLKAAHRSVNEIRKKSYFL